eukprot:GHUV01032278.1.p1 GENE.GHUV01032278.1~~GHUV01032278.1.p1  ORF type:complete len:106 (+),score=1.90 GHUV01032278.1:184-501(+)
MAGITVSHPRKERSIVCFMTVRHDRASAFNKLLRARAVTTAPRGTPPTRELPVSTISTRCHIRVQRSSTYCADTPVLQKRATNTASPTAAPHAVSTELYIYALHT